MVWYSTLNAVEKNDRGIWYGGFHATMFFPKVCQRENLENAKRARKKAFQDHAFWSSSKPTVSSKKRLFRSVESSTRLLPKSLSAKRISLESFSLCSKPTSRLFFLAKCCSPVTRVSNIS